MDSFESAQSTPVDALLKANPLEGLSALNNSRPEIVEDVLTDEAQFTLLEGALATLRPTIETEIAELVSIAADPTEEAMTQPGKPQRKWIPYTGQKYFDVDTLRPAYREILKFLSPNTNTHIMGRDKHWLYPIMEKRRQTDNLNFDDIFVKIQRMMKAVGPNIYKHVHPVIGKDLTTKQFTNYFSPLGSLFQGLDLLDEDQTRTLCESLGEDYDEVMEDSIGRM